MYGREQQDQRAQAFMRARLAARIAGIPDLGLIDSMTLAEWLMGEVPHATIVNSVGYGYEDGKSAPTDESDTESDDDPHNNPFDSIVAQVFKIGEALQGIFNNIIKDPEAARIDALRSACKDCPEMIFRLPEWDADEWKHACGMPDLDHGHLAIPAT